MQHLLVILLLLVLTVHISCQNGDGTVTSEEDSAQVESLHVCECSDEKLLGKYNIVCIILYTLCLSYRVISILYMLLFPLLILLRAIN